MFDSIREARNDALHQGAVARHLTTRVVEAALILEDALETKLESVQYLMVQQPVAAYPWHTMAAIRQIMLSNAFSYLPIRIGSDWHLLSDHRIAIFLRKSAGRKAVLARTINDLLEEDPANKDLLLLDARPQVCSKNDAPRAAVEKLQDGKPILVLDSESELIGIITPADLL